MNNSESFADISKLYYDRFKIVEQTILKNIDYGNSINIYPQDDGIMVSFIFRGESDYELKIPLEYCESGELIKNYYNRFLEKVKGLDCISGYTECAESLFNEEIKKIKEIK